MKHLVFLMAVGALLGGGAGEASAQSREEVTVERSAGTSFATSQVERLSPVRGFIERLLPNDRVRAAVQLGRVEEGLMSMGRLVERGDAIGRRRRRVDLAAAREEAEHVDKNLDRLHSLLKSSRGMNGGVALDAVSDVRQAVRRWRRRLGTKEDGGEAASGGTPEMSRSAHLSLLRQLKRAGFDSERLKLLQSTFQDGGQLSARQVSKVLKSFAFDNNRRKAAIMLYAHVVDPENWVQVYETFQFDSEKDAVRKAITGQKTGKKR